MIFFAFCVNLFYMKKTIKFLALTAFLTISSLTFAENISLDKVFSSLTENKVTCGNFKQEKSSAKLKKPLKSNGKFIFSPDGIVWQTLKPFPSTTTVTKDSIIQTGADGKKSVIDGSSNEMFKTVAASVSSIFGGKKEVLEEYFNIKSFESDEKTWKINLTPKDSTISSTLKEVILSGSIKTKKSDLDELLILQNETESVKYKLSNQTHKQELSTDEKAFFQK